MISAPKYIVALAALMLAVPSYAQLTFKGTDKKVIAEKVDAGTGLDQLYVIYNTEGVTASYKPKTDAAVKWYRYSNLGGGYAEEIAATVSNKEYTVELGKDDMGYIVEEGTDRHYYWVVNYANHHLKLNSLTFSDQQECDRARLTLDGYAAKITYFTINGAARELARGLVMDYYTLKYDSGAEQYVQISASQTINSVDESIGIIAPLCDTYFTLTGDRFLEAWDAAVTIESPLYKAIAVESQTSAEQEARDNDNEQVVSAGQLGGSAPVYVSFAAAVTDAAIYREWQMSRDPEFEVIDDRFQQLDFDYTFVENGNTYVRFVVNNAQGSCEYVSETYEVYIGESGLLCPNIFSPNGDGVNDEWKVSYKSIVEFECHIFNRWGQEMMSTNNPAQGWDGKYKGKYVPTGVYYYVVKARGADGKKYNLNGDINIIKSKGHKGTSEPEE